MKEMLSDVATSITKSRINNLQKSMEPPGRLSQLEESTVKSLVEKKQLDALLVFKKPTASSIKNKRSPFCLRQHAAFCKISEMTQTPNTANNAQTTQSYKSKNFRQREKTRAFSSPQKSSPVGKKLSMICIAWSSKSEAEKNSQSKKFLTKSFLKATARERVTNCSGLRAATHPLFALLQAEDKQGSQQQKYQEGCAASKDLCSVLDLWKLNSFTGERNFKMESLTSICRMIRRKDCATPSPELGLILRNQSIGIFGQPFDNRQVQKKMYREYKEIILQTKPTGVQNQDGEVQHDTIPIDYSCGDNDKLTNYDGQNNTEKLNKLYWESTSNVCCSPPWLPNAEETFEIKKQFLEETEIIGYHGDSEQSSNSELRILETESAKMERSIVSTRNSKNGNISNLTNTAWGIVVRSQSYTRLWLPSYVVGCSVLVYSDNTKTLAYVRKFGGTTSPKLLETDCSNGMVSINRDIQETEQNIWSIRRGSVCNKTEQKAVQILQLVPGQSINSTESSTGKDNYDNNYANVKVCDLVSNSGKNQNSRAHTNTGRQISATKEQILVADGMENQRRTLQQKGLTDLALDLITANTRSVKRRSKYYTTQKGFIDWRHEFMKFLNESDLIKVTNNFIDIKPIIDHFKILGPINILNTKELTAKTCWLIAVCKFLRASDINQVDKKRKSSSIEIKAHSDEILCPSTKDFSKPLTVNTVKDNKMISPKARAIGATIAARTGISTDAILTQANWLSYYMFSSYYKLSNYQTIHIQILLNRFSSN
ncbi:hypothetical protein BB561_006499 [Smittium simulii]|uniref:Uncharacterized protein n=1 Tax=Smittium simulii TaxID=133385 RepID=A0A2T9Y3N7_9FUNG|nr:hypothetical protein BB561_006499 [Smittium simulii]